MLAAGGGVAVFVIAILWAVSAADNVSQILGVRYGLESSFPDGDAVYKKYADTYAIFAFLGVAVAAAVSFSLLAWERRPKRYVLETIYWILLAVALPMSVTNFWGSDMFVSRIQQAWLNLVLCFLGVACCAHLAFARPASFSAGVLRAFAIFFLATQAVFLPGIYAVLFWLNWQNAISLSQTQSLTPGWISAASGIGGLIVSILQYRRTAAGNSCDLGFAR